MFDMGFLPEYCQPHRNLFEQRMKLDAMKASETSAPLLTLTKGCPMKGVLCTEEGAGFLPPGQVGFCEHTAFLSGQRLRANSRYPYVPVQPPSPGTVALL